jgi:putative inorganic carbon (HCO3(-)) transporter
MAISLDKIVATGKSLKGMIFTRGRMFVLFVGIAFLGVILSGTRGMWMAGVGSFLAALGAIILSRYRRGLLGEIAQQNVFKYIFGYFAVFFLLFVVAYPIIASPQFDMFKLGSGQMGTRMRSIIDFGETSNSRRIEIWKDSLKSIIHHPILGVGINNFPVVVGEDLAKVKAGSSAHNLYLHIAAEMGIPALLVALYFLWLLLRQTYINFRRENDPLLLIFFSASLIFIFWNLIYSLTDIALFDERALLLFVTTCVLIFGYKKEA